MPWFGREALAPRHKHSGMGSRGQAGLAEGWLGCVSVPVCTARAAWICGLE